MPKNASLRCQDSDDRVPFDVTFKISENANTSVENNKRDVREVMAHKIILASFSPVFKKMFYGAMKETKDVIIVEQSTADAFSLLIDYFYQVDVNCKDMTIVQIFDLVNLAERYDVPDLMDELKGQMELVPITMNNIMEVATIASKFSYFEAASSTLLLNCAKVFKEKVTKDRDQIKFMVAQNEKGLGTVALKLLSIVESLPPFECNNCHEKDCLFGNVVPLNKLEEGLKVQVIGEDDWEDKHLTAVNINHADQTFNLRDETGTDIGYGHYGVHTLVYDCQYNDQE